MTHAHISSWVIALVLFLVIVVLQKQGKNIRILKMVLRLFDLFIIITGLIMIFSIGDITSLYILKLIVGIWIIGLFEIIVSRNAKHRPTKLFWIQFIIAFLLVLYLGFSLPLGFMFF